MLRGRGGERRGGRIGMAGRATFAVQVQFPLNVNSMTVTLNADNTWTVTPNILMASLD